MLKSHRIDLPRRESRGAVSVMFAEPSFEVVGVHLGLTANMRRRQMQALATSLADKRHPVVIAGDFNECGGDIDLFGAVAQVITPGPSFHASRPYWALDRFAIAGAVRHVSSHVHDIALAKRASDHLPIVLDVEFTEADK